MEKGKDLDLQSLRACSLLAADPPSPASAPPVTPLDATAAAPVAALPPPRTGGGLPLEVAAAVQRCLRAAVALQPSSGKAWFRYASWQHKQVAPTPRRAHSGDA